MNSLFVKVDICGSEWATPQDRTQKFYDFQTKIGEDDSSPYSFQWDNATVGIHEITAHAIDNDGLTSISEVYSIEVLEAPDCTGGPDNGDYTYEFSDDLNGDSVGAAISHPNDVVLLNPANARSAGGGWNNAGPMHAMEENLCRCSDLGFRLNAIKNKKWI